MPSFNDKRQPQGTRLRRRLPSTDRRSTSHSDGSLRYRNGPTDSFSSRRLRARWLAGRDPGRDDDGDGEDGGHDGHRNFHEFADGPGDGGKFHGDDPGESSGDDISSNDGLSDDDSDAEDDNNVPQQTTIQSTTTSLSSSGSIVTLTAVPPSQVTTSLSDVLTTLTPQIATPSPSVPIVQNPVKAVPTTPTTTSLTFMFPSGRKEEGSTSSVSPSITTSIPTSPPTTSAQLALETTPSIIGNPKDFSMEDNDNSNGNGDGQKHKGHGDKGNNNKGGLDSTAEHLLIAAGAIGAFILLCFISWIVYRVLKRPKGGNSSMGFLDKLSWRRKAPMEGTSTWDGRTVYMANEAPPNYEKGEYGTTMSGNFYGPAKAYPPGPGSLARSNSGTGTLRQLPNDNLAPTAMMNQYEPDNDAASLNNNINLTMRTQMSQMSQPYYKESEMPRRPPPENRASQLSSISSGFGDGDIIIPQPLAVQKPLPDPGSDNRAAEDDAARENPAARDSWVNRDDERRETMYTTTSEDRPARFRSITSWVNQQAGRAKRAGSRARERGEVPVMPAVPGEINMTRQTAYR